MLRQPGLTLFFVLLSQAMALAADLDAAIQEYADYSYEQRPVALKEALTQLEVRTKDLKRAKKDKGIAREHRKARIEGAEKWVESIRSRIDQLNDPLSPFFAEVKPFQLEPGQVRRISCSAMVFDVQSPTEAIISLNWTEKITPANWREKSRDFWFTNWNGEPLITRKGLRVNRVLFCDGTKSYTTVAGGSRTVRQVQIVEIPKDDLRFTRWREARTWTSTAGTTLEAVLGGYERGQAVLHGKQGKPKKVRLDKLSEEDQEFVLGWQKRKRAAEKKQSESSRSPNYEGAFF